MWENTGSYWQIFTLAHFEKELSHGLKVTMHALGGLFRLLKKQGFHP